MNTEMKINREIEQLILSGIDENTSKIIVYTKYNLVTELDFFFENIKKEQQQLEEEIKRLNMMPLVINHKEENGESDT